MESSMSQEMNKVFLEMKRKREAAAKTEDPHKNVEESKGVVETTKIPEEVQEEPVFVESSMHRKGSRVYKNNGWKYSRTNSGRSGSSSSFRSIGRYSSSEEPTDNKTRTKKSFDEAPPRQSMPKLSKEEMDALMEKKFDDIFEMLRCAGVDINI